MKRIFVTGATGYIGSHLVCSLLKEYEVHILVREPLNRTYIAGIEKSVKIHVYDGTYESMKLALQKSSPQLVYHLAAYYTGLHGAEATPLLVESNITLGAYLLEAMAQYGCRKLIYAGTVMEHYRQESYLPLNLYAATKRAFFDLMEYYEDADLLDAVTLVLGDTYGPQDHRPKILNLIRQTMQDGGEIALSDGMQDYDLVHIDDVIHAFSLAGKQLLEGSLKEGRFQIMAENPISLRETVECMAKVNGLTTEGLLWGKRPAAAREIRKAVRLFPAVPGWKPGIALEDGLKQLWHENHTL